jgi:hypothetical protein
MDISQKFSRLVLVDSFSIAWHHEQYNASMAMMLAAIFPRFVYWVGDGQWDSVSAKWREHGFDASGIERRRFRIPAKRRGRKDIVMSHLLSAWYNVVTLFTTRRDDLVIFNYNNPAALLPIKVLNALLRRTIIIITHGELEFVALDPSIPWSNGTRRVGRLFARLLKWGHSRNIFYLVLGDSIKQNLEALHLVAPRQIISLDHPYLFNARAALRRSGTIKTVGVKNFSAGFDTDTWIARLAAAHPSITFSVIGTVSALGGGNIENHTVATQRSRDDYEGILRRMDALLFLYPAVEYRLKASGAIFDCLELGIPVIAVHNDYFDYMFRLHGQLGYLYTDLSLLITHLDEVLAADHTAIRRRLAAARKWHSPEKLTGVLRKKLDELFLP